MPVLPSPPPFSPFFFFNDTATTEIYTLSLHDALPICQRLTGEAAPAGAERSAHGHLPGAAGRTREQQVRDVRAGDRSEEHTSELQSQSNLVCRLLLEKKKKKKKKKIRERRKKKNRSAQ